MNISSSSKVKISPTASFVLSLGSEVYQDGKTSQAYFESIDHSEGKLLIQNLQYIYEHSELEQLVVLRKNYVRHLFDHYANLYPKFQVCILGAGLDPLSLHLLERYDNQITNIFEVDMTFMDEKRAMYTKLIGDNHKLKCWKK
jgi:O-methyltransferase involved in polyketide biosynthesis